MKIVLSCSILLFLFLLFPLKLAANSPNQFITIVNPVRISSYTKDPVASINAEYDEIRKRNLSATWLLTYDVISREDIALAIREFNKNQELGIFMEITPEFARQAKVIYKKTDSWHRANSLFLSGYTQEDRKKLIDLSFNKFKEIFGYFPTSVGAWWNDSFSLAYMKDKYGITANLTCADQFQTDGYHIWGQYWSTPFYPSKYHAGIPAKDVNSKLDLVTVQWASRDPLNGYQSSVYSTQDYFTQGQDIDYFKRLIKLYAGSHTNKLGQITLGLEGDLTPEVYKGIYAQQMDLVLELEKSEGYQVTTMQKFANWYRSQFKDNPDYFIESDDLLGKAQKAIWYQSSNYRVGMVYDEMESKLTIIDLRTYFNNFEEPHHLSPNFQIDLFINIPSVVDVISNPQSKWEMRNLELKSIEKKKTGYSLNFGNGKVIRLTQDFINFENFDQRLNLPVFIKNSPKLNFKKNDYSFTIYPKSTYSYGEKGLLFPDLTIEATYFLWRPKVRLVGIGAMGFIAIISFVVLFIIRKKAFFKFKLLVAIYLPFLIASIVLFLTNYQIYSVNQSETDALDHLVALPYGKVVVVNNGCLVCRWQTKYPPPAFAAKKSYVGWLSHKPIVYNATIFKTKSREEGKQELNKLGAKYIYLVRYEGYFEEMPFSPGDLNVEKIYENVHTQIWQVKAT